MTTTTSWFPVDENSYAAIQEALVYPKFKIYPFWVEPPASGMKVVAPDRLNVTGYPFKIAYSWLIQIRISRMTIVGKIFDIFIIFLLSNWAIN